MPMGVWLASLLLLAKVVHGFAPPRPLSIRTRTKSMAQSPQQKTQQAILVQLERLLNDDENDATATPQHWGNARCRHDLVQDVDTLLQTYGSPVKPANVGRYLPGTRWRLAVTTNDELLRYLPEKLASISYYYQPDMVHCVIDVHKKTFFGRKKRKSQRVMTAFQAQDIGRIHYGTLRAASHVNMLPGAVVNAIDFAKTRRDSIQSVYFDRILWMEKGVSSSGTPFSNLYVRHFYHQPKSASTPSRASRRIFRLPKRKKVDWSTNPQHVLPPDLLEGNLLRHRVAVQACEQKYPVTPHEMATKAASKVIDQWTAYSFPESTTAEATPRPPFGRHDLARVSQSPLLSPAECALLIQDAERALSTLPLRVQGSARYGTPAHRVGALLPLEGLSPSSYDLITQQLRPRILASLGRAFSCFPDPSSLRLGEARLVRYDAQAGQVELGFHRDTLLLTANFALNDPFVDYTGGGTIVEEVSSRGPIRLPAGHVLLHPGDVRHAAAPITSGKRYVLVLFFLDASMPPHGRYLMEEGDRFMNQANGEHADIDAKHVNLRQAAAAYAHALHCGGRVDRGIFPGYYYTAGAALFADPRLNA
jgi:hypothetical protein